MSKQIKAREEEKEERIKLYVFLRLEYGMFSMYYFGRFSINYMMLLRFLYISIIETLLDELQYLKNEEREN